LRKKREFALFFFCAFTFFALFFSLRTLFFASRSRKKRRRPPLQIIRAGKLEARPLNFLNFKGTPSQEGHKTIFSSLKICKMALSNQIDFLAFLGLRKMTTGISSIPEYHNPLSPLPWKMASRRYV
jgi:hypothetical protein